jgi:hypothetical protein
MGEPLPEHTLQALWLAQLQREFLDICQSYRVELPLPIFQLSHSRRLFGSWQEETGILTLSVHLIAGHSWAVVLQVLKHEMAHQLACLRGRQGAPHGPAFQEACEQLGVLPEFRRPGVLEGEAVAAAAAGEELSPEGRKCLERIEKLLALGRSSNEHEAALAIDKARTLLARHHLHCLAAGGVSRFASLVVELRCSRVAAYRKHICSLLKDCFAVRVVLGELYDASSDRVGKTIELFGSREKVAAAEYCYHFLEHRLPRLWAAHRQGLPRGARRSSYYLGVLRGFREQLTTRQGEEDAPSLPPEAKALMVVEEERLQWFVALRFPRLRRVAGRGARVDGRLYHAGVAAGRELQLRSGVDGGQGPLPLLGHGGAAYISTER